MKGSDKGWPDYRSKERLSYTDWPELSPEQYEYAGRHFTAEQFEVVEKTVLPHITSRARKEFQEKKSWWVFMIDSYGRRRKGPPEMTIEFFLLDMLREATYAHHVRNSGGLPYFETPHTNAKVAERLEKKIQVVIKRMSDFQKFLLFNSELIARLSDRHNVAAAFREVRTLKQVIKKRRPRVLNSQRRHNATWHYFLEYLVDIYEAITGEPAGVSRRFVDFAWQGLSLADINVGPSALERQLKRYLKERKASA